MHEFGVAQGLLNVVLAKMAENAGSRIVWIKLEIGVLSGVEEEALRFAFTALAEGSPAQNTELRVEKIPLRCYCSVCDSVFECRPFAYRCPSCGMASHDVRTGKEMNVVAMEIT
ncbi:MAG TPA: hydrogenase maturation nickel metallochaperone HypA [Kiritimatiellia bacterium]|mgnify:CR=1 FL=1|nr:hydrogenase maturation nickel metallochaperone HypA [Kiritimatiellia bacterium]HMP00264.1 hydrogenase maturation nickel metallochaperone HypA [Kiritimatiellia bacterium]HMP97508.1 hydrogenase maturation nickel metallochaperone HypA [Kiritimatiellia bacterium]